MNGVRTSANQANKDSAVFHRSLAFNPALVTSAQGSWLTLDSGKQIFDATGGAAVSCLGHGDQRVIDAVVKQMQSVAYIHSGFFGTTPCEELAKLLMASTGGVMTRALFLSSGSEAMESALKLARQYWLEAGQAQRTHFIARKPSYHGNTLGALCVSGHQARKEKYLPLLASNTSHVSPAYSYRGQKSGETTAEYVARLAQELDDEIQAVGPQNVCAFVAEPVVGAAMGCVPAPPGYFSAIKEVCQKYDVLLIFDEIMSGMGRTGTLHAWQHPDVGVSPDIQTIGKGLGAGYAPISAVLVGSKVVDGMQGGTGIFTNGQTYQGHPVACAAALAVQRIVRKDDLLSNVETMGALLAEQLEAALGQHPNVGDIRGRGLFWGIELVQSKRSKDPFPVALKISERISERAMDHTAEFGISLYPCVGAIGGTEGDIVILAPAFNISVDDVRLMVKITAAAIDSVMKELTSLHDNVTSSEMTDALRPTGDPAIAVIEATA